MIKPKKKRPSDPVQLAHSVFADVIKLSEKPIKAPAKPASNLIPVWLLCAAILQALTSGAQPVTKIAAGGIHSLFLKSDGSLWAMGYEFYGELGDGTYSFASTFPEQTVVSNVTTISAGYEHSLLLKNDGSFWVMGNNGTGQLGDGTYNKTNRAERIMTNGVTAIAAGYYHSLFLKSDGSLWAMGGNHYGQLGDGTYATVSPYGTNQPEQIVSSNVMAIAAGQFHSLFLKNDGSLWAMGYNRDPMIGNGIGQLGDGTYNNTNQPEQIVASNVTAIAAGREHSLFLKSDGSLWAMGWNSSGQLGDGTYNNTNRPEQIVASNVTAIAAGGQHSLFLESDGSLWAMGNDGAGQLGDGKYIAKGPNRPEQIVASNVAAIAAGDAHSLFLKSDGSLWAMGSNGGQLGDGTLTSTNRPEQILAAYNQIFGQLLGGTNMQLSFVGIANANYALDRSSSLSPPNWIPQLTNVAGSFGALMFSNAPDATPNSYWRIRSVP